MNERIHRALRGHRIRIFIRFFFSPLFSPRTRVLLPCLLKKRATPNVWELYFYFSPFSPMNTPKKLVPFFGIVNSRRVKTFSKNERVNKWIRSWEDEWKFKRDESRLTNARRKEKRKKKRRIFIKNVTDTILVENDRQWKVKLIINPSLPGTENNGKNKRNKYFEPLKTKNK